jgi:hypothetical protein
MAVVKGRSDLLPTTTAVVPDPARRDGRLHCAVGTVTNAATDSSGSMYHLFDIPADAIFEQGTRLKVDGWGFAAIRIGTRTDVDALVSQTKATEAVIDPIEFGDAKHGLPVWEALGLTGAPESNVIGIFAHAIADATGAGSMKFDFRYLHHS